MEQLWSAQDNTQVYVQCVSTPEGPPTTLDLYVTHTSTATAIETYC